MAADLDRTVELLLEAGLPTEDIAVQRLALAAECDGKLLGVIGLESLVDVGLLRSLVVSKDARGQGIGATLVSALESTCIAAGVRELWLLTIDADPFFVKHGYVVRTRKAAPNAIRQTQEFSSLCPDNAVLMSKRL